MGVCARRPTADPSRGLRWAETEPEVLPSVATHRAFRTPAPVLGEETSWQRQLVHVLQMNTSCTRSLASKPLLHYAFLRLAPARCRTLSSNWAAHEGMGVCTSALMDAAPFLLNKQINKPNYAGALLHLKLVSSRPESSYFYSG